MSISACFTVYVPVTGVELPTATSTVLSTFIISSFTANPFIVVFPVLVTVIVYVITSPAAVTLSFTVPSAPLISVAVLPDVYNIVSSTVVSTSSSSSTVVGFSPGFSTVSPETETSFNIVLSSLFFISVSYVTVYVADISLDSPAFKSPIIKSFGFNFIPTNFSSTTTFFKSLLPLFITVIAYSITSPSLTSMSFPILTVFPSIILLMSATSLFTVISAVSFLSSFVGVPPTSPIFLIFPSMLFTSTVNSLVTVEFAPTLIDHVTIVFPSSDVDTIASSLADTNFVPSGTVSVIYVEPSTSPVFVTVIVYVIWSPTFAVLTTSLSLVITLDLLFVIIAVFVGSPSLLSSPFAIAVFEIVPVTGTSSPSSFNIILFTFTVNLAITVSPAGTVTTHFTPTTFCVSSADVTVVFVPTVSLTNSPSTLLNMNASSIDTKVVFCGILSVISMFSTSLFPLFVTFIT